MTNDLKNFLDGKIKEIEDNTSFIRGLPYDDEKLDLIMKTCIEISNFVLDLVEKKLTEIEKRKENVLLSSNIQDHLDDAITAGKEGYKHQVSTIINNLRV